MHESHPTMHRDVLIVILKGFIIPKKDCHAPNGHIRAQNVLLPVKMGPRTRNNTPIISISAICTVRMEALESKKDVVIFSGHIQRQKTGVR